ncbi:MAG: hypothetical protein P4L69_16075 [Desulfosporosinus sp.]|nr:hypothetical protein [Desulfosporosinus sp.]
MSKQNALLLVGSPRESKSTSDVVGSYLLKKLDERGWQTKKGYVGQLIKSEESRSILLDALDKTDLIILSSPLYIDSLPSNTIRALQVIKQHRRSCNNKPQRLVAIINSGFPEAEQNYTALQICRRFAIESGFEWLGGLPLGGGSGVDGKPLDKLGILFRKLIKSLNLSADAINKGELIPEKAIRLMKDYPIMWLYFNILQLGIKLLAKKGGVLDKIHDQPFKDLGW